MNALIYLNENLSREEADRLFEQSQAIRRKLTDLMFENMETLDGNDAKSRYLSSCIPFIVMI